MMIAAMRTPTGFSISGLPLDRNWAVDFRLNAVIGVIGDDEVVLMKKPSPRVSETYAALRKGTGPQAEKAISRLWWDMASALAARRDD